jgi:uncharacterized membrane protein YcaP (DUF421 family)
MTGDIDTFFNSADRLASIAMSAVILFVAVVVLIRFLGKRATGQMSNFDWIISVTVGSLAASGILLKDVSVADALLAIVMIGLLQWSAAWLAARSDWFENIIRAKPRLLLHKGELLERDMRRENISHHEIYSALRRQGYVQPGDANWVVLENDGTLTVIPRKDIGLGDAALMSDVISSAKSG